MVLREPKEGASLYSLKREFRFCSLNHLDVSEAQELRTKVLCGYFIYHFLLILLNLHSFKQIMMTFSSMRAQSEAIFVLQILVMPSLLG